MLLSFGSFFDSCKQVHLNQNASAFEQTTQGRKYTICYWSSEQSAYGWPGIWREKVVMDKVFLHRLLASPTSVLPLFSTP